MSSFICDKCGTEILDTHFGYITECEHYPLKIKDKRPDPLMFKKSTGREKYDLIPLLKVASDLKDPKKREIYDAIPLYLLIYSDQLDKLASYIPETDKTFRIVKYALRGIAKLLSVLQKRYKLEK